MTDLEELKKLAEAATPGPWEAYDACVRVDDNFHKLIASGIHCEMGEANRNAAFIAAANPHTVLELLSKIEQLQAENADLRKKLDYSEMAADAEARYANELKAKNDALKAERDDLRAKCNHIMTEHGERVDECGRLREDAERYRLLRNRTRKEDIGRLTISIAVRRPPPNDWVVDSVYGDELDAAIDAAMQKEG